MTEAEILKSVQLEASRLGARLFRNNCGMGWIGKAVIPSVNMSTFVRPGDVLIRNARPLHAGLCVGSSDLIGWRPLTITREMVGKMVAIFLGVECKTTFGKASEAQDNFIEIVNSSGGTAGICTNKDDLKRLLEGKYATRL